MILIQQNAEDLQLVKKNNIEFSLMCDKDNRDVLNLINSTSIKGNIEILFSKEPNYINAINTTCDYSQSIIGRYKNKVEVLGTRAIKEVYLNGEITSIGYLSDLKVSSTVKKMQALSLGFNQMRILMQDKQTYLHLATIIDDNRAAKIALTWKNKNPNIPNFYNLGLLYTYFIIPLLPKIWKHKINIIRGNSNILDKIVKFLNEEGKNKQFYPKYSKEYFLSLYNFNIEDFYIAMDKENNIIGVMAKWEQTPFKQVIIKKYNGFWKWIKLFTLNLLPKENQPIKQFYLSFIAIKNNDNSIFETLLNEIYSNNNKYKYFSLILHSKDALNKSLNKYFNIKYKSRLYITEYLQDSEIQKLIDDRVPYLELAGL